MYRYDGYVGNDTPNKKGKKEMVRYRLGLVGVGYMLFVKETRKNSNGMVSYHIVFIIVYIGKGL